MGNTGQRKTRKHKINFSAVHYKSESQGTNILLSAFNSHDLDDL